MEQSTSKNYEIISKKEIDWKPEIIQEKFYMVYTTGEGENETIEYPGEILPEAFSCDKTQIHYNKRDKTSATAYALHLAEDFTEEWEKAWIEEIHQTRTKVCQIYMHKKEEEK